MPCDVNKESLSIRDAVFVGLVAIIFPSDHIGNSFQIESAILAIDFQIGIHIPIVAIQE